MRIIPEASDDVEMIPTYNRKETEKPMEKRVANRKTAYVFTPVPQTAGYFQNRKTDRKLSKNRKTACKKVPKPQNRKQVDPPPLRIIPRLNFQPPKTFHGKIQEFAKMFAIYLLLTI